MTLFKTASVTLLTLLMIPSAIADTSSRCPGETGYYYVNYRHRNPTNGGFVSHNAFVDDTDDIFIAPTAAICGSSHVSDHAKIYGTAVIDGATISGRAEIFGQAKVSDGAEVTDEAKVSENAEVSGSVRIYGQAVVAGSARISNYSQDYLAQVYGKARVTGSARISENTQVFGNARVNGNAVISGEASISGSALIGRYTKIDSGSLTSGTRNDPDYEGIAKAKRDAEIAAAEAKAAAARAAKAQQERDAKITRYNEIVQQITSKNYLANGAEGSEVAFPQLCRMTATYRLKEPANSLFDAQDHTYFLKIHLGENVRFAAGAHYLGSGPACVQPDLRGLAAGSKSERSYTNHRNGTKGYAHGSICLLAQYSDAEGAEYVAGLLTEMSQLCQGL